MAVVVTHSTPADATFSATGAVAWNANHVLTGVGTMAEQNANNVAITGGSISGVTGVATSGTNSNITSLTGLTTPLSVAQGGSGTATPSLVQGTNITISGSWPNQTINASSTMVYPGSGIAVSTGSAWGTSYSTTGSGTVVALATSPVFTTPTIGAATATSIAFPDATQITAAANRGQIEQQRLGAFT
jgi:hypothetical protein